MFTSWVVWLVHTVVFFTCELPSKETLLYEMHFLMGRMWASGIAGAVCGAAVMYTCMIRSDLFSQITLSSHTPRSGEGRRVDVVDHDRGGGDDDGQGGGDDDDDQGGGDDDDQGGSDDDDQGGGDDDDDVVCRDTTTIACGPQAEDKNTSSTHSRWPWHGWIKTETSEDIPSSVTDELPDKLE